MNKLETLTPTVPVRSDDPWFGNQGDPWSTPQTGSSNRTNIHTIRENTRTNNKSGNSNTTSNGNGTKLINPTSLLTEHRQDAAR